jgi:SAM-dependent methyltransferase
MLSDQFRLNAELEQSHWWFVGRRRILRAIIDAVIPVQPQRRVVDVGCGTGGNIASLSDRYATTGIDPSAEAIQWAHQRFVNTEFLVGEAPLDCKDRLGEASLVTLNDVLEHVPDDFLLLSGVVAHTPPGCCYLLTVPAEPALWSMHDESHRHYRRYTLARFERMWSGLPVDVLFVSPFNSRLYPLIRAARWLGSLRQQSFGAHQTDLKLPSPLVNRCLTGLFAGERHRLLQDLSMSSRRGNRGSYRRGVSLLACLRRREGMVVPFTRPADVLEDEPRAWMHDGVNPHGAKS